VMANIAFIGDCHLGYRHRFKAQRLRDYARAFEEAVAKALRLKPDVVVFTGDLVHHPKPDPVSLRTVMRKLVEVADVCPVVVCIGNHEIEGHLGTTYSPIYNDIHEDINVLTSESPHVLLNIHRKTYGFHGFEYTRSRERAEEKLRSVSAKADGDVNILCLHQAIERYLSPHEISVAALREAAPNYDLIVSGHVHKHQPINEVFDTTPAFYCGSTERISFNESGNRNGFLLFEGDYNKPRFVKVDSAGMSHIKEEFDGTPEEINRRLEELINGHRAPLLSIELTSDVSGDFMDVRRDWSTFEPGRTILEVNVVPKAGEVDVQLERVELSEDLIREYFAKSGNENRELMELCVQLFNEYGT
jgi:DNA repair exonuclease SbcCD nuclease subunit